MRINYHKTGSLSCDQCKQICRAPLKVVVFEAGETPCHARKMYVCLSCAMDMVDRTLTAANAWKNAIMKEVEGGFTPRTEESQIEPAEFDQASYESSFSSEPRKIDAHIMMDSAADIIAQSVGLPDAEGLKRPCIKCDKMTHSVRIKNGEGYPMCPSCVYIDVQEGEKC